MSAFKKIYVVSNAFQFTNKDQQIVVCLECIPQQNKAVSKIQKFYFTLEQLETNWMIAFYEKDVPGVWFNNMFLQTEVEYKEDILALSEDKEDLK